MLVVFVLTHALLTHTMLLRAFDSQAAGWRVAAATLSMPLLLPLILSDPDGDRLPRWLQVVSFPLNSAIWAAGIAIIATTGRRRRRQHRGFEVRPREAIEPPSGT